MRKLKALAVSDLHLGEPKGLLFNSGEVDGDAIKVTVDKIAELSRADGDFDDGIEELILVGDILELSEAEDETTYENARAFFGALLGKVNIDKIVYVPGNHDHHMWIHLLKEYGESVQSNHRPFISSPNGFVKTCISEAYPAAQVEVHYPYYLIQTDKSCYFFDHGHLFSKTLQIYLWFANIKRLGRGPKDVDELEAFTSSFMEFLWYPPEIHLKTLGKSIMNIPFFLLKILIDLRGKVWGLLRALWDHMRMPNLETRFIADCTPVYDHYVRRRIMWYLTEMCAEGDEVNVENPFESAFEKDFHFVFGHTHQGGRILREDRKFRLYGRFISVWNTGGWLVPSVVFSPDAYLFYIENTKDGLKPNAYKLVKRPERQEGDYSPEILTACRGREKCK
jgi:hypothetical protein